MNILCLSAVTVAVQVCRITHALNHDTFYLPKSTQKRNRKDPGIILVSQKDKLQSYKQSAR